MKPATALLAGMLTISAAIFTAALLAEPRSQPGPFLDDDDFLPTDFCMDNETKAKVRSMMLKGLDDALAGHIETLWEVMMKDATGQPERARTGMERGLEAYLKSRRAAIKWEPKQC